MGMDNPEKVKLPSRVKSYIANFFFIYEMPKDILLKCSVIGILYRLLQFGIIFYFVYCLMFYDKGYQAFEKPISGVLTRIHGTALGISGDQMPQYLSPLELYTDADLVVPPTQNSGFFLITRLHRSLIQQRGVCPETSILWDARCTSNSDCPVGYQAGKPTPWVYLHPLEGDEVDDDADGHGPFTGDCNNETGTCEVFAWCPIPTGENIDVSDYLAPDYYFFRKTRQHELENAKNVSRISYNEGTSTLTDILNFTVSIKNSIEFPYYKVKQTNILPWMSFAYIENCIYNKSDTVDKFCPNIRLYDILSESGGDVYELLQNGGMVDININWNCNLDMKLDLCLPKYAFKNLANFGVFQDRPDFTRWQESYYAEFPSYYGSIEHKRILRRVTGIHVFVSVTGRAGKFSLLQFTMKLGSILAYFVSASLICDLALLYLSRDRYRYRNTITRVGIGTRVETVIEHTNCENRENSEVNEIYRNYPTKPEFEDSRSLEKVLQLYRWAYRSEINSSSTINFGE